MNKKTILLVEDEIIIAITTKIILENYGYIVIVVNTGEDAIKTIKNIPNIQLLLIDIDLGKGLDGIETAEIILKNYDIPIIFRSSHIEQDIIEKIKNIKKITSYSYITKNSNNVDLDISIKMAFKLL